MLSELLQGKQLILASKSPRRQALMKNLNIEFSLGENAIEEFYPHDLKAEQITQYLSKLKASAFGNLGKNDILITCDTIVWFDQQALEKPQNKAEALKMLQKLSGNTHEVITSICLTAKDKQMIASDVTRVFFRSISSDEIGFYVKNYLPFDKAGAYGIQEWIGHIGVERIEGSYFNVMGLPTHLLYKMLKQIVR